MANAILYAQQINDPASKPDSQSIQRIQFVDSDGNPTTGGAGTPTPTEPADGSITNAKLANGAVTPAKIAGYQLNHGATLQVKQDGSGFDFHAPSEAIPDLKADSTVTVDVINRMLAALRAAGIIAA